MKEEWKVYIKGVPNRGDEVLKVLTGLGAKEPFYTGSYSNANFIYFINHKGEIDYEYLDTEPGKIIMDNYTELYLPEKWKDGDVLINRKTKDFAIYHKDSEIRDIAFRDNVYYVEKDGTIFRSCLYLNEDFSLATDEEIQQLYKRLHKNGVDWDAKKKQLVKWRWKPKEKETYWCICPDGHLSSGIFSNDEFDNGAYNFCNCFRTREEAEAMAVKVKKLLKGE